MIMATLPTESYLDYQQSVSKKVNIKHFLVFTLFYPSLLVMERVSKNPTKTRSGPDFLKPEPEPDF